MYLQHLKEVMDHVHRDRVRKKGHRKRQNLFLFRYHLGNWSGGGWWWVQHVHVSGGGWCKIWNWRKAKRVCGSCKKTRFFPHQTATWMNVNRNPIARINSNTVRSILLGFWWKGWQMSFKSQISFQCKVKPFLNWIEKRWDFHNWVISTRPKYSQPQKK